MQTNDLAEKLRLLIDNEEIPGFINCEERVFEKGTLEVPAFKKIHNISNGVQKIPVIAAIYKLRRGSVTLQFFKDWYFGDEKHDLTIIRNDADGVEFDRTDGNAAECVKFTEPVYAGEAPVFAQVNVILLPFDYIPLNV